MKLKNVLIFFTLTLPKSGAKIAGFPLYFSLLASLFFFFSGLISLLQRPRALLFLIIIVSIFLVNLIINVLYIFPTNDFYNFHIQTGEFVGYISSLFAFVCFYGTLKIRNYENWKSYLVVIFYMLVAYAFIQKAFGDYNVVIPGITANLQDALTPNFLQDKNNMIWGIGYLKATSTYQNGNLFGVNLLLIGFTVIANYQIQNKNFIFPLSCLVIAVLLTASASVYFGLLIALIYMLFCGGKRLSLMVAFVVLAVIFVIIMATDNFVSQMIYERLINRDLTAAGGRSDKIIEYYNTIKEHPELFFYGMLFYKTEFSQIYEILPISVIQVFGFPLFLGITFFYYSKVALFFKTPYILPFISYFAASLSDGAYWLPPTATNMCIVLGLCTLWHNKNIGRMQSSSK